MGNKTTGNITLYAFQKEALRRLLHHTDSAIDFNEKNLLLKAPTGSGKTIIMGSYIESMLDKYDKVAFVWLCETPNLTLQSKRSIDNHFNVITREFDEVRMGGEIENRSVVFVNWEIIKENTIGTVTGDTTTSLVDLCGQVKDQGIKLIFIIDEAHTNANSKQSLNQVRLSNPDVIIDVTATPNPKRTVNHTIEIDIEDVQKEEVIKSSIVINKNQSDYNEEYRKENNIDSLREFILHKSILLRDEMESSIKRYSKKSNINPYVPLLLIQLPPHTKRDGDLLGQVEEELKAYGYFRGENLAVYQSNDYSDELDNICKNEKYKILLFKNAIAKGWDCPRASVLTMLRKPQTISFTTQTIGRIMRVPGRKYFPEKYDWLNKGYIYIESDENKIIEAYRNDIQEKEGFKTIENKIKDKFKDQLTGIKTKLWDIPNSSEIEYKKRIKEELEMYNWGNILTNREQITKENIIGEYKYKGSDESIEDISKEKLSSLSPKDKKRILDNAINSFNIERNILTTVIRNNLMEKYNNNDELVDEIILSNLSKIQFEFEKAKEKTKKDLTYKITKWIPSDRMEKNEPINLSGFSGDNYLYENCLGKFNDLELKLADFLDNQKEVIYWLRNKNFGLDAFPVAYLVNGRHRHFHPDFIIKTNEGVLILETKGINDQDEAREKYRALKELSIEFKYIKVGFVKEINNRLHIYNGTNYDKEGTSDEKWKLLDSLP